jgi:hypothetical protein
MNARDLEIGDALRTEWRYSKIVSSRFCNTEGNFVLVAGGNGLKAAHAIEFTLEDGETVRLHPGQTVVARKGLKHQIPQ